MARYSPYSPSAGLYLIIQRNIPIGTYNKEELIELIKFHGPPKTRSPNVKRLINFLKEAGVIIESENEYQIVEYIPLQEALMRADEVATKRRKYRSIQKAVSTLSTSLKFGDTTLHVTKHCESYRWAIEAGLLIANFDGYKINRDLVLTYSKALALKRDYPPIWEWFSEIVKNNGLPINKIDEIALKKLLKIELVKVEDNFAVPTTKLEDLIFEEF